MKKKKNKVTKPAKRANQRVGAWSATPPGLATKAGVDAYMNRLDGESKEMLAALRRIVLKAAPGIDEALIWSTPVYSRNGLVCWLHSARAHAAIGFYQGASLSDPHQDLEGTGRRLRHFKVRSVKEIRKSLIAGWVRQAVALNSE